MNDRLIRIPGPAKSRPPTWEEEYDDTATTTSHTTATSTWEDNNSMGQEQEWEQNEGPPESPPPPAASASASASRQPIARSLSSIVNRASKFRAHRGISQDGINEDDDEDVTEQHLRAMTQLASGTSHEYSCNAMSRLRRAHFSEMNGATVGGYGTMLASEVAGKTVSEKKRRAQDVLLSQQLRLGVIPEQLLRKIPRMGDLISLDLSHYSMGDDLGICLGRR